MRLTTTALFLLAAATGGCSSGTGPICTADYRPGLTIEVRDAKTNVPIAAASTIVIRDGSYVETLGITVEGGGNSLSKSGAYERAGTYSVEVSRAGYASLTLSGIVVTRDECHVIGRVVAAALTPLP